MTGYFNWENTLPDSAFGEGYWPKIRFGDNSRAFSGSITARAKRGYWTWPAKSTAEHGRWDEGVINWHNVNLAQGFRGRDVFSRMLSR